jgi:hypothetical protein
VVAQHHHELVAEIGDEALTFIEIERDAFIVVIGEAVGELQRPLIEWQQAPLLAGNGDARDRMRVQDADRVMPHGMDRAVNREAGRVDAEAHGVIDDVSVQIDRHQVGRRDFFKAQAVGVDEEAVLPAREPGGDVGVDAVVETQPVNQPIGGCKVDPGLESLVCRCRPCLCGVVGCARHFRLNPFSTFSACVRRSIWARLKCRQSTIKK